MWHILVKPGNTGRDEPGNILGFTIPVDQFHRADPLALRGESQTTSGDPDRPEETEHSSSDESIASPDWGSDAEETHDIPQRMHDELHLQAVGKEAMSLDLSFPQSALIFCNHHRIRYLGVDPC